MDTFLADRKIYIQRSEFDLRNRQCLVQVLLIPKFFSFICTTTC